MNDAEIKYWQKRIISYLKKGSIKLTKAEKARIEIADFGLNNFREIGLSILIYINTLRVCAKELVLLPYQTCPEHMHPNVGESIGKEETFRCRKGKVYLYVPGESDIQSTKCKTPASSVFSVFNEVVLDEGEQYTIYPNTLHWFQAGRNGAIVSEFSTRSADKSDIFTDSRIKRVPD